MSKMLTEAEFNMIREKLEMGVKKTRIAKDLGRAMGTLKAPLKFKTYEEYRASNKRSINKSLERKGLSTVPSIVSELQRVNENLENIVSLLKVERRVAETNGLEPKKRNWLQM